MILIQRFIYFSSKYSNYASRVLYKLVYFQFAITRYIGDGFRKAAMDALFRTHIACLVSMWEKQMLHSVVLTGAEVNLKASHLENSLCW